MPRSILDPSFSYIPAAKTDIRQRFDSLRSEINFFPTLSNEQLIQRLEVLQRDLAFYAAVQDYGMRRSMQEGAVAAQRSLDALQAEARRRGLL